MIPITPRSRVRAGSRRHPKLDLRLKERVKFELLDIVQSFPNLGIREKWHASNVHIQDDEELLALVGFDDVLDNIVLVLNIDPEHLNSLALVPYHLADFAVDNLLQILNPNILGILLLFDYA